MKKILASIALLILGFASINAQNEERVHTQIFKSAYKIASDTKEDTKVRKIASFKVDAISYLKEKALIHLSNNTNELSTEEVKKLNHQLDSMSYFMHEYVNLFTKEYAKAKTAKDQAWVMKIFRDASLSNPLYKDDDIELIHAYVNRADYLTQFSLDTDWIVAIQEVREKLRGK